MAHIIGFLFCVAFLFGLISFWWMAISDLFSDFFHKKNNSKSKKH